MNFEHYKQFSTEDFLLDENFLKLAKGYSVDGNDLAQFKSQLPEKSKEIALAIGIVNGLKTIKPSLPIERKAEMLKNILQERKAQFRITLLKYAASVLLVVGLGASSLFLFNKQSKIESFAESSNIRSEKAELILANGKRVEIESKMSKIEYAANGSRVCLNDTSRIEQSEPSSGEGFNQVIVPFGKRSTILLSDGTKVWLNSGSRLVYSPVFAGKSREVFLEGEAYFEVAKNKNKPFFVRNDAFRVKVLGTKFLVQAYKNENEYNTVLVEGKVNLAKNNKLFSKEYELLPNQMGTLSGIDGEFTITRVEDVQNYTAWINGYLNFENENLISLTKRISRYYNIEIEVKSSISGAKFSGKLDLKDSPERILDGLSTIFKTKYEKQGDKFVFFQ